MKYIKNILIHVADFIEAKLLRHRSYSLCQKIGLSDWWIEDFCKCWYCKAFYCREECCREGACKHDE